VVRNLKSGNDTDDIGLLVDNMTRIRSGYEPTLVIGKYTADGVGEAMNIGAKARVDIKEIDFSNVDQAGDVGAGARLRITGDHSYDYQGNTHSSPNYVYRMRSTTANGGAQVLCSQFANVVKGANSNRPTAFFNEVDTTATKYYFLPGIIEHNPSGASSIVVVTDGSTTLTESTEMTMRNTMAVRKATVVTTAVGNITTGEDNLQTASLSAGSLWKAGRGVRITAWGTTANNANAKTLKLYFGTAVILTNSLTVSIAGTWYVEALVFSTGTDAQDYIAKLVTTGTAGVALNDVELGTATQDDAAAITIKCTGDATATNDIVQEGLLVEVL
jgi:hypothetical protein